MEKKTRYNLADNQVRAFNKLIRISASKLSLVADLIRRKTVARAVDILKFSKKRVAGEVLKTLLSAVANAENNKKLSVDSLFVKEIWVGKAVAMKRYRAGPRGQAKPFLKPFSHLTIILEAGAPAAEKAAKKTAPKSEKKEVKKETKKEAKDKK
ncbi:MAG: 50S ribosomal protein L22 [Rickettsiales bacterium]|jgi:large subunit ribosomal protein L22|nr:50S ribosomal protein L22 [Rickettsiales bacterium]